MITIKLDRPSMVKAARIGCARQIDNILRGRKPAYGAGSDNDYQKHVEGAMGECAVAVALGLPWDGALGDLDAADVGNLQVRTRSKHWYDLIVHRDDPDDDKFILVTGKNGTYFLQGWLYGWECKQEWFLKDPTGNRPPAYFVPKSNLRPIETLLSESQSVTTTLFS